MALLKGVFNSQILKHASNNFRLAACLQKLYSTKLNVVFENDIKFEELKEKVKNKEVTIIDSRTPPEANERGIIEGAILIPINPMAHSILADSNDFKAQFGVDKPEKDAQIVSMCKLGMRARTAQMVLMAAGYTNVRVYVGSFEEWREKGGDYVMPDPPIHYKVEIEGNKFEF